MGSEHIFDTLRYANRLKEVGVPEKQAEVQAEMMAEVMDDRLATKNDIKLVQGDIKLLQSEIKHFETTNNQKLKELELRMTVKLGSIMVGGLGLLVVLMKLLKLQ